MTDEDSSSELTHYKLLCTWLAAFGDAAEMWLPLRDLQAFADVWLLFHTSELFWIFLIGKSEKIWCKSLQWCRNLINLLLYFYFRRVRERKEFWLSVCRHTVLPQWQKASWTQSDRTFARHHVRLCELLWMRRELVTQKTLTKSWQGNVCFFVAKHLWFDRWVIVLCWPREETEKSF